MRAEPIVFLPLIQKYLQRTNSECQHGYSDVVHANTPSFYPREERWIFDQRVGQIESKEHHWQGNKKDPAPGIAVDDPSSEHWAHRRGKNGRNAVESKGDGAPLGRKSIVKNRLRHRLQSASGEALHSSEAEQY